MQILQWFFKGAHEQEREITFSTPGATKRETVRDPNAQLKNIKLLKHRRAYGRTSKGRNHGCNKNVKIFAFISTKDIAESCLYSTSKLKRLGSYNSTPKKMKREEIAKGIENTNKVHSVAHVGNRVLPLTEERNEQCGTSENRGENKGDKKRAVSRMKELLRWAAAATSEKGGKFSGRKVLRFRRGGGTLKAVPDDEEEASNDSPKISFRWEVESCSTTSFAYSAVSVASSSKNGQSIPSSISIPHEEADSIGYRRKGNWITTDSEFVVLEL